MSSHWIMATVHPEFSDLYSLAAAKGFIVIHKKNQFGLIFSLTLN